MELQVANTEWPEPLRHDRMFLNSRRGVFRQLPTVSCILWHVRECPKIFENASTRREGSAHASRHVMAASGSLGRGRAWQAVAM
eukprot:8319915-Alexandrium_andersonii.AAC.1